MAGKDQFVFSSQFEKLKEIYPMEALLIRGFVLALALSGFGASTVSNQSSNGASISAQDGGDQGGIPPACPYSDPNACGVD